MDRKTCLETAEKCVCTDRNEQYGAPEDNFGCIAMLWSSYLAASGRPCPLDAFDVATMMVLFKVGRIATALKQSADTFVDIAGYAACGCEIVTGGDET